jgi:hypothetical protein
MYLSIIVKNVVVIVYVCTEKENIGVENVMEARYVSMIKISTIVLIVEVQIGVKFIIN